MLSTYLVMTVVAFFCSRVTAAHSTRRRASNRRCRCSRSPTALSTGTVLLLFLPATVAGVWKRCSTTTIWPRKRRTRLSPEVDRWRKNQQSFFHDYRSVCIPLRLAMIGLPPPT